MASATKPPLRQYKKLPVFIEEDHNDVVPHMHRAIASRHLPMSGIAMLHFDSHPDLLLPLHMQAEDVFDREKLYSGLSIENWILPLAYAGHISEIYWLKPPWADQLPDALDLSFCVGKWKQTGEIRITLDYPYFLTEALYAPESQLTDVKCVTLHVVTVKPQGWTDCDMSYNPGNSLRQATVPSVNSTESKSDCVYTGIRSPNNVKTAPDEQECNDTGPVEAKRAKLDAKLVANSIGRNEELTKWSAKNGDDGSSGGCGDSRNRCAEEKISSTGETLTCSESVCNTEDKAENTTTSWHGKTCAKLLQNQSWLMELQKKLEGQPYILDIDLDFYSTKDPFQNECSPEQTALLRQLFEFKLPAVKSEQSLFEFSQARQTQLDELDTVFQQLQQQPDCTPTVHDPHRQELLDSLLSLLRSDECRSVPVDYEMLYRAGCTFDGTSLPHHVSSSRQIHQLMNTTAAILQSLPKPTIVTVSRSSVDDYCPQNQVDVIQESMLKVFTDVYGNTDVNKMYEEQQQD